LEQWHEINADTLNAMQVEIDDWKARALKAEQVGDRAVPDAEDYDLIDRYLRNNLDDADYGEYLAALDRLVTPQPAAQEPTSAAPVVRQMVVELPEVFAHAAYEEHPSYEGVGDIVYYHPNAKPANCIDLFTRNQLLQYGAAQRLAGQQRETCTWTEQDDKDMPGTYESSCGEMWSFIDGGVKENRVTYCHHCGGKVVPASPQEQT